MALDGLIICAGYGSRLRGLSDSKPLVPVCGQPLIAFVMGRLAQAGVARIVAVTGHAADRLEPELARQAQQLGVTLAVVRLDDWSKPNGHSVIAGAARIVGDYLLVMADHLFSAHILPALASAPADGSGVVLAVDRRLDNPLIDPDDATFVRTDAAGRISAIGKGLDAPDAVDCGAFRATPALAAAIRSAIAQGRPGSLSDGMQLLADAGQATTFTVGDAWWLDVDDPAAHALAQRDAPLHLADLLRPRQAAA